MVVSTSAGFAADSFAGPTGHTLAACFAIVWINEGFIDRAVPATGHALEAVVTRRVVASHRTPPGDRIGPTQSCRRIENVTGQPGPVTACSAASDVVDLAGYGNERGPEVRLIVVWRLWVEGGCAGRHVALPGIEELEPQLLKRVSMMGDRSRRTDEQLWMSLPRDCFPDGRFSGLLTVESYLVGYTDRLRISLPATTAEPSLPLLVRIVANDGSRPEVVAVAALTVEEDASHTVEMDQPERLDAVGTRIEIVRDLNLPLLPVKTHTTTRTAQWALLALRACRTGSPSSGRTWWLRSSDLYADVGDDRRASEAEVNADLAASDLGHGPFWVESLDHDDPTSDHRLPSAGQSSSKHWRSTANPTNTRSSASTTARASCSSSRSTNGSMARRMHSSPSMAWSSSPSG